MKYILRYEIESKYIHFVRLDLKYFDTIEQVRNFLITNIDRIHNYNIYKLTDLSNK